MTLDRKGAVRRNELLPRECFYALEQLIERFGFECADADEHALGAPQVQVRPCERVLVTGEQHAAVFRVNIGQPAAEAQFVRDDALQPEQGPPKRLPPSEQEPKFLFNFYIVSVFADFVKICDEMGYFKFGVERG